MGCILKYDIDEMGLVSCRRSVIILLADMSVTVVAKLVILNVFGVPTEKLEVQFW